MESAKLTSTNDRHTPQRRLTIRHRQHILFIIFCLAHSPLAFSSSYLALLTLLSHSVKARQTAISCQQAINMMPVSHVQSGVCDVTVLADAGTSASDRILTAVDLMATGVIVNKHFLNVTYSPFKEILQHFGKCASSRDLQGNYFFLGGEIAPLCKWIFRSVFDLKSDHQVTSSGDRELLPTSSSLKPRKSSSLSFVILFIFASIQCDNVIRGVVGNNRLSRGNTVMGSSCLHLYLLCYVLISGQHGVHYYLMSCPQCGRFYC